MAADFVGYTVLVTLKSPPNSQVQGVVGDVAGQRLTLRDVTLLWNGQHLPLYHIDAPGIADLELSSHQVPHHPVTTGYAAPPTAATAFQNGSAPPHPQHPSQLPHPRQENIAEPMSRENQHQNFVDPAILSFNRKPAKPQPFAITNIPRAPGPQDAASPVMIADSESPARAGVKTAAPIIEAPAGIKRAELNDAAATLSEPFSNLNFTGTSSKEGQGAPAQNEEVVIPEGRKGAAPLEAPLKYTGKRSRRGGRNKFNKDAAVQAYTTSPILEDAVAAPTTRTNVAGKGWRQTAFVEPARTISPQKPSNGRARRTKVRNRKSYAEDPNGWATEDATDIQEMGDFDFATNLSKFDKRRVFDEIRNDDTTTGEERLVSFNRRVHRPGTNEGKNLHYTENVLDDDTSNDKWNSEAGETEEDEISEERFSSGRNSVRARSRVSTRTQSRKGSAILGSTLVSSQISSLSRGQISSSRTGSPQPHKGSPLIGSTPSSGSLLLGSTNRQCPCVGPLQMIEIEQLAIAELGLGEEIITENAGRGIAEAAVFHVPKLAVSSTILVLAGNHRTGSRAVCAARHFRNRGYRVTLCVLGLDREDEFMEGVRKQIDIFKKVSGRVMRWEELSTRLSSGEFTPDLVIDALFGVHIGFDDLRTDDQANAFEMISWANRSNIEILSVDVPAGLSAVTGEATLVQGSRLSINSKFIVCLAAPKTGLLHASSFGEGPAWNITVADIGISQVVWRKYGSRRRHGVDFGNHWVVPLRFQAPTP
ncbi:YjeF family domain-containing protein [Helicocarpus griseus UAMH5409]|uniref:Enhancer of mRNA-decapping protein 3 n=1 Tax=Helicocarpus griseus UAMH5409 TaxID=1447875 RepID=A0A2B7X3B1_9EURO|nr:YjeF family domain-containing protein [Helicocarpus griseus UAMH5409]